MNQVIKVWTIKRPSILPIQLTTETQWQRSMLMKKQKQLIYSLFCQICPQKSRHWAIHQGRSNMLVSHRPEIKQWSTTSLCHYFQSIRIEQPCNTKQKNFTQTKNINLNKQWKSHFLFPWKKGIRSSFHQQCWNLKCLLLHQDKWGYENGTICTRNCLIGNGFIQNFFLSL